VRAIFLYDLLSISQFRHFQQERDSLLIFLSSAGGEGGLVVRVHQVCYIDSVLLGGGQEESPSSCITQISACLQQMRSKGMPKCMGPISSVDAYHPRNISQQYALPPVTQPGAVLLRNIACLSLESIFSDRMSLWHRLLLNLSAKCVLFPFAL
jgi:hypothetical protein